MTTMDGGNANRLSGTIFAIHVGKKKPVQSTGLRDESLTHWRIVKYALYIYFTKTIIFSSINHISIEYVNT